MKIFKSVVIKNDEGHAFFQYFASLSAMMTVVTSGLHYGWPSPSLPKLLDPSSEIPITENEGFWLATMPLIGAFLGSFTAPYLVNNIGRHKTILIAAIPYLISWIMIIFSLDLPLLYSGRFIGGAADGWVFSSVPIYIGEISQPKIRGLLGSGVSVSYIIGILVINVIGSYLSIKMTALVACLFPVLMLITFVWMPESPYYLIMKNKHEEAKRSLQIFIGPRKADIELSRIDKAVKEDLSKTKSNPLELFTVKRNRRAVLVMMLVRTAQQLSGTAAIVFYTQNIFKEAGSNLSAEIASIAYFSIQVVVTIIAAWLVDRLGRRPLLLFSVVGACLSLLVEGLYYYFKLFNIIDLSSFSIIPIVALIVYIVCFSIGLQNIPLLMLGEIFHPDIKAVALGFADIYFATLATGVSKFFQVTRDSFGMYLPFLCFSAFCAVATILIYIAVPETKGKTLEEIQDYFKRRKNQIGDKRDNNFKI